MFPWKRTLLSIAIILLDVLIGLSLGVLMMGYDDFYEESKGEYWSWESMNTFQKQVDVSLNVWWLINGMGVIYILYRVLFRRYDKA